MATIEMLLFKIKNLRMPTYSKDLFDFRTEFSIMKWEFTAKLLYTAILLVY